MRRKQASEIFHSSIAPERVRPNEWLRGDRLLNLLWELARCKDNKIGYLDGFRGLGKVGYKIKKYCLTRGYVTCGYYGEYEFYKTVQSFLNHSGYKYLQCMQTLEFIRSYGPCRLPGSAGAAYGRRSEEHPK